MEFFILPKVSSGCPTLFLNFQIAPNAFHAIGFFLYPLKLGIERTQCRSSRPDVLCKKSVFENFAKFTGKHMCQSLCNSAVTVIPVQQLTNCLSVFDHSASNFFKKETLAQVFSCEFCQIFKNTFFTEHIWWLLLPVPWNELTYFFLHSWVSNSCPSTFYCFFFLKVIPSTNLF